MNLRTSFNKIPPLEGGFFTVINVIYTIFSKVLFCTKQKEGSIVRPIVKIEVQDKYNVLIELASGHKIILDLKEKLHTLRFHDLSNPDVFKKAFTDGYSIMWKNGKIVVSFGEILDILKNVAVHFRAV